VKRFGGCGAVRQHVPGLGEQFIYSHDGSQSDDDGLRSVNGDICAGAQWPRRGYEPIPGIAFDAQGRRAPAATAERRVLGLRR
jgi:hypothetical protein